VAASSVALSGFSWSIQLIDAVWYTDGGFPAHAQVAFVADVYADV
jgi:hypothetical protein